MYYDVFVKWSVIYVFFFSSRRRHTRCALVTGVQTCALPILPTRHTRRLPSLRRQTIPAYTPPPFAARSQKRGPLVNIYFMLICINRAGVETNLAALFVLRQNGCGGIALVESISFPDLEDRKSTRLTSSH